MTTPPAARTAAHSRYDAVIVGARVAGATAALQLARAGHRVLLLDHAGPPRDTLSTHALARTGVLMLRQLGLLEAVLASGSPPIRDVVFHHAGSQTRRRIKDRHGIDFLLAPRRNLFDQVLVEAACAAGVTHLDGATVTDVARASSGRVTGVVVRTGPDIWTVDARVVVGADGLQSQVAQAVSAPVVEEHPAGGALFYTYYAGDWPAMEYYASDVGTAGIFPTHHGEACLWVSLPAAAARAHAPSGGGSSDDRFLHLLGPIAPDLVARLSRARRTGRVRGAIGLPNHRRQTVGDGWVLIGDAAYHRDPITGHGMSDAMRDAMLLARALDDAWRRGRDEAPALLDFAEQQHALMREVFDLTQQFVTFPPAERFIELQIELSRAIDRQAAQLVQRAPVLPSAAAP